MEPFGVRQRGNLSALTAGWSREGVATAPDGVATARPAMPSLSEVFAAAADPAADHADSADGGLERVQCSGCGTDYGLPPGLVPVWGGRVRCPRCSETFSVGPRAAADRVVANLAERDVAAWRRACADNTLWADFGEVLLEAYRGLRERHGAHVAARAFRRALEVAAPGVPWLAPPTPKNPLGAGEDSQGATRETLFERRSES